jgi:DinB superfamily
MTRDRCSECGFEYDLEAFRSAGSSIEEGARRIARLLRNPDAEPAPRRTAQRWSRLEYGCHVRDVLLVQRERVLLARREVRPDLVSMGRDDRVEHDGYSEQAPIDVARQLEEAARLFANVLSRLGHRDWDRTVMYNYPEPAERSLRWVAVHTLHEVRHHLRDMEESASEISGSGPAVQTGAG